MPSQTIRTVNVKPVAEQMLKFLEVEGVNPIIIDGDADAVEKITQHVLGSLATKELVFDHTLRLGGILSR